MRNTLLLLYILIFSCPLTAQNNLQIDDLSARIPVDPSVRTGKLENGMTYYIKANKKPENRAELMLAVKAGSIDEDDDQKGLAHFCEHLAFNGTKNFPKQDLINYLESVGVRFGADLNAFTSYDRTVYLLQLPTDNNEKFDKGLQVLQDWSSNLLFDHTEIDKERGVILEEWRLRKGAQNRVRHQHLPFIYFNSRYALRDVIGDTNIITKAPYEAFKRFYNDWYRPDLMAVIAVGDFDADKMAEKISGYFSAIPARTSPRPKIIYDMPKHKEVLVSIATDKELPMPNIGIIFKNRGRVRGTYSDLHQDLASQLFLQMLNERLNEIRKKPTSPFVIARGAEGSFEGNSRAFTFMAGVKGNQISESLETIFYEAFRAMQQGFTLTEFDRAKKEMLRRAEQDYNERDKTNSRRHAMKYMINFTEGEEIPSEENELELYRHFLPLFTLSEINKLANVFVRKESAVITVSAPERADITVPKKDDILAIWDKSYQKAKEEYKDDALNKPLFNIPLTAGSIASEKEIPELGITELKLSNGLRVILKPTDFKNDEILFFAFSPGGTSLLPDEDFYSCAYADNIVSQSGTGDFNDNQLDKYLAGKIADAETGLSEIWETVDGSASPQDIETLFQLIYLKMTQPRKDSEAFKSFISNLENQILNKQNNPRAVFNDSVQVTLADYHFRSKPLSSDIIGQINLDKSLEFYKNRFADASDFTFIFVGNFKPIELKQYLLKYLANLPSVSRNETWKDNGVMYPKGKISKSIKKGIEKQSTVRLVWNGEFIWSAEERYYLQSAIEILNRKLREVLREEKGGVYGVGASATPKHYPRNEYSISVRFGCSPDRVDELVKAVVDQMNDMSEKIQDATYIQKTKEIQRRQREVNLKENHYWLQRLSSLYQWNENPEQILNESQMTEKLTGEDIQRTAKKYFKQDNFIRMVLYPEK